MTHACPCCGQTVTAPTKVDAALNVLTPLRRAVVARLARNMGKFVPTPTLIDAGWGHDPNGGPTDPERNLAVLISCTRKKIAPFGLEIISMQGSGYQLRRAA